MYEVGISGIPIINVNNNCCTGATALYLGYQAIKSGQAKCVLCVGFDKMQSGSLQTVFEDRSNPLELILKRQNEVLNANGKLVKGAPQIFGNAALEYMSQNKECNTSHLDKIAFKNHQHSVNNPYSQNRKQYTMQEIRESP